MRVTQLYACLAEHLGIEFVYDEAEREELVDWRGVQLSAELYHELKEAVKMHSITQLTGLLAPIAADAPALGAHLRALVESYDISGIKAILGEIETR